LLSKDDLKQLSQDIKKFRELYRDARFKWASAVIYGENEEDAKDEHYLKEKVEEAFMVAITLTEKYGFNYLRDYIIANKPEYGDKLLESYYSEVAGEQLLYSLFPLYRVYTVITETYLPEGSEPENTYESEWIKVRKLLSRLPTLRAKCNKVFNEEKDLDDFAELILLASYPDLNSNPSIPHVISYTLPDTGIASIGLLVEYKYIAKKTEYPHIRDEMQSDIRNWAQDDRWKGLIFCIYQKDNHFEEEIITKDIKGDKTNFEHLSVVLIS